MHHILRRISVPQRHLQSVTKWQRNVSDFRTAKINHEFDHVLDRNGDGAICKSDISELKQTLDNYYSKHAYKAKNIEDRLQHSERYHNFWLMFSEMADETNDGRISKKEWFDLWEKRVDNAEKPVKSLRGLPIWIRLMPSTLFPIIDIKGDEQIDFEEFNTFWQHMLLQYEENADSISRFNRMNNGCALSKQKFEQLYSDYYLSDDVSNPAKYIIGAQQISD